MTRIADSRHFGVPSRRRCDSARLLGAAGLAVLAAALAGCGSDSPTSNAQTLQTSRPTVASQSPPRPPANEIATPIVDGATVTRGTPQQTAATLARLAKRTGDEGDIAGAIQLYRRSLALDGSQVPVAIALGQAQYAVDDFRGSIEAYRQALRLDANNLDAVRGQAVALIGLDHPREAAEQFRWALARMPRDFRLHNGLGVALDMHGDHQGAQAAYRQALALAPNDPGTLNNLGLSLALTKDYAQSVQMLGKLAQSPQATARARQNLALVYGLMGQTERAAEISRMDLDDESVRRNLAYYEQLRMRGAGPTPAISPDALPALPKPTVEEAPSAQPAPPSAPVAPDKPENESTKQAEPKRANPVPGATNNAKPPGNPPSVGAPAATPPAAAAAPSDAAMSAPVPKAAWQPEPAAGAGAPPGPETAQMPARGPQQSLLATPGIAIASEPLPPLVK